MLSGEWVTCTFQITWANWNGSGFKGPDGFHLLWCNHWNRTFSIRDVQNYCHRMSVTMSTEGQCNGETELTVRCVSNSKLESLIQNICTVESETLELGFDITTEMLLHRWNHLFSYSYLPEPVIFLHCGEGTWQAFCISCRFNHR